MSVLDGALFATDAVRVSDATTAPVLLTARISNLWRPFATEVELQNPAVSPKGMLCSVSTSLPSTRNCIEPGSSGTLSPLRS